MNWREMWPHTIFAVVVLYIEISYWTSQSGFGATAKPWPSTNPWTKERKLKFREKTRRLWHHGFDSYIDHAFPMDELMPKSCRGIGPDYADPDNKGRNDVMANFSLTLVDNLDSFITLNNRSGFEWAVRQTIDHVSFDQDVKPQVFEITIRGMGGLLSGHMFASDSAGRWGFGLPWYNNELLDLAYDLGKRLLPAFKTRTGIPYARTNLRHGVPRGETVETCTAGAGSLLLEFTTLSRWSGDPEFEKVARKAFFAIWNRRSGLGLIPNTINIASGSWLQPEIAGIGAGIDSFYEYALKMYVLTGGFYDVWTEGYSAIMKYSRGPEGFWYRSVGASTGDLATIYVDSLSAFWPGLQVLAGDVQNAIKSHLVYWNLWRRFSGMPETFNIANRHGVTIGYPLRPEFIESTYFLYRATRDTFYLDVGERVLRDLTRRAKVDCGLATISNLQTGERGDRMESFALSETLKYLYLLFDEDNQINFEDQNVVFTTEGHLITLSQHHLKPPSATSRRLRQKEQNFCPVYQPTRGPAGNFGSPAEGLGLTQSVRNRPESDYGRFITGLDISAVASSDAPWWDLYGWCAVPQVEDIDGTVTEADKKLSTSKVYRVDGGFMVRNITGIKARMTARMDGQGYDVTMLGQHRVLSGQKVFINDPALHELPGFSKPENKEGLPSVQLRLRVGASGEPINIPATTALFGADVSRAESLGTFKLGASPLYVVPTSYENIDGCAPHTPQPMFKGTVLVVNRGTCTFMEKLERAKKAGFAGVIVISNTDGLINSSIDKEEHGRADSQLSDVALVVLTRTDGDQLLKALESAMQMKSVLSVEVRHSNPFEGTTQGDEKTTILYINGKALINTVIML
ncbi:Alpha mannosidase-like protein [Ceratobasidium theobromae]|uniref:alpha-1,2-Mannosidase n=1 Tax=Ceratobasidium theobromae TaxID=1582974 RepID=A0A5N5QR12_9AGAM|nr:Alpha mannosidase-like protein [Ceratobasidium theobromae]